MSTSRAKSRMKKIDYKTRRYIITWYFQKIYETWKEDRYNKRRLRNIRNQIMDRDPGWHRARHVFIKKVYKLCEKQFSPQVISRILTEEYLGVYDDNDFDLELYEF